MISRLPKWVWLGGWALAFIGGIVNAVALLGFDHQTVTNLTGTTSLIGAAVASFDKTRTLHLLAVLGSFIVGTVFSGFIIQDTALKLGRRYSVALLLESALLTGSALLMEHHSFVGYYLAACASGLQNAMASTYSGSVVRTTHLSGMFTDLGIFFGHYLRGVPVDTMRLRLSLVIISGFLLGGIFGAYIFHLVSYNTLFIPAALTAIAALVYGFYLFLHPEVEKEGYKPDFAKAA